MSTLLVATRKGLFVAQSAGAHWNIASHHFAGEPVTQVLADPRDGAWYAALRLGHSWQAIAAPGEVRRGVMTMRAFTPSWSIRVIRAM